MPLGPLRQIRRVGLHLAARTRIPLRRSAPPAKVKAVIERVTEQAIGLDDGKVLRQVAGPGRRPRRGAATLRSPRAPPESVLARRHPFSSVRSRPPGRTWAKAIQDSQREM
jgi:hypothetical protein